MKKVVINKYIVADPDICHGKPTFKGTRIMVWQILDLLKSEASEKEIIEDFPSLKKAHIKAALDYASSLTREGYVVLNTQPQIPA
ncbi:DUF433 domain-containing protein [Candidatus Daviesbacteria bacterium]|nr:DUF433 domain-containing protein [Candidatus Daviesbacteria bacterium]